jgi:hypothetical protein
MLVRTQVVDPEPLGPRFLGGWLAVEEKNVRLDALGVEDASGQTQQGVDVGLVRVARVLRSRRAAAFEKDIVGHNDSQRGRAVSGW